MYYFFSILLDLFLFILFIKFMWWLFKFSVKLALLVIGIGIVAFVVSLIISIVV